MRALESEVYIRTTKESSNEKKVRRLKKVVYGLSDASRVWQLRVVEELSELGATISKYY